MSAFRPVWFLAALAALVPGSAAAQRAAPGPPADLVVHHALVTTLDAARPSAAALAVRGGRIVLVGTDAEALALRGPATRVVDADGRRLIPGLNDSHLHLVRGGRFYATELRWDGVRTLARALEMVAEQAARTPPGQWVRVVGGWSPEQFAERRLPTPAELTAAAPDTPVFVLLLYSRGFLNQAGTRALALTDATPAPPGGRYELSDAGAVLYAEPSPTILYRTVAALPALSAEDQVASTRHFYRELARLGLTSAVDAGGGGHAYPDDYTGSAALALAGEMPIRVSYYLFAQTPGREAADYERWMAAESAGTNTAEGLDHGFELEGGGENLVWAAGDYENFLAPRPELHGFEGDLATVTRLHLRNGWPLRIHATYDESIVQLLGVFERVDREERAAGRAGLGTDRGDGLPGGVRWAIDHAETASDATLRRVRALGGGIAVQARMAYAGEAFAERYGAAAAAQAPRLRRMLDLGIPVGAGTDGTRVASYDPWPSLAWLVTGRTVGGAVFAAPENRLSREEALRLYTLGSAWFSGEETVKGRLAPGQFADFALLSDDYFAVADDRISTLTSVLTVVGGDVVYGAGDYAALAPPLAPLTPAWSPVLFYGGVQRPGN